MLKLIFILLSIWHIKADFISDREDFIKEESLMTLGANLTLNDKENIVNTMLMQYKLDEINKGFENPEDFLPSQHFFHVISKMEQSEVFKFIKELPKGGSLHSHDTAIASGEFLLNMTYMENLYGCISNNRLQLRFSGSTPTGECDWKSVDDMRNANPNFDNYLKTQLSIVVEDPHIEYPTINDVWNRFGMTFGTVEGMILHVPAFKIYLRQVLQELYDDNVMFFEMRTTLPPCYNLDGSTLNETEVAGLMKEIADDFMASHSGFQYVKIIYAPSRRVDMDRMKHYVEVALQLREMFGEFFGGFDMVGQEDKGYDLVVFAEQLQILKDAQINLLFHAAETNWFGLTDENLVDAVLLGTKRIGHGYGLIKHPKVMNLVKERGIAVEISPISNQVLKLVDDLRNHPANYLISNGFPVVICCDDPGFWGAKALSYDWYEAFMAFTNKDDGLKVLKQLALNTYEYSLLGSADKSKFLQEWQNSWDSFIDSQYKKYIDNLLTNGA